MEPVTWVGGAYNRGGWSLYWCEAELLMKLTNAEVSILSKKGPVWAQVVLDQHPAHLTRLIRVLREDCD